MTHDYFSSERNVLMGRDVFWHLGEHPARLKTGKYFHVWTWEFPPQTGPC